MEQLTRTRVGSFLLEDSLKLDEIEALARAGQTGPAVRLQEIFDRDPEKRLEGAAKVLNQWKLEYRKML